MSKSNKVIITLAVAAFLMISLIVGLVVVFAEETQPVVRNVNAVYRVIDADCSVSASFTYGDQNSKVYLGSSSFTTSGVESDNNVLSFKQDDSLQEQILKPTDDIVLNKTNNSVIFEFNFANTGENNINATLLMRNLKHKNCTIVYSTDALFWSDKNIRLNILCKEGDVAETVNYYVKVSLNDLEKNGSFSVDFEWTINGVI